MSSAKLKKDKKIKPKLEKKLVKLINDSDSGSDSEHELSHYLNDRVKLMKEVIHILKPKKIKSMAPNCIKHLSIEEINSMLLEELLGISNKRLKKIFHGEPQDDDSSSTEDEEVKPADVISLDDVTDDDFIIDLDSDNEKTKAKKKKKGKIKDEPKEKRIKKEKEKTKPNKNDDGIMNAASEEQLMSVLELLELQARARAIRSQLALENSRKAKEKEDGQVKESIGNNSDVEDAIIIESPKNEEIVITSSESETDEVNQKNTDKRSEETTDCTIVEELDTTNKTNETSNSNLENTKSQDLSIENPEEMNKLLNKLHKLKKHKRKLDRKTSKTNSAEDNVIVSERTHESDKSVTTANASTSDAREDKDNSDTEDGIILNVDQAEIDSIILEPENIGLTEKTSEEPPNEITTKVNELDNTAKEILSENTNAGEDKARMGSEISEECVIRNGSQKESSENRNDEKEHISEEGDGIILNLDQSEMESINLDSS